MSLYSQGDERAIRAQRMVADWSKSGLLSQEQREQIQPTLGVDLRRTNTFLRITLFLFGYLIITACAGLAAVVLGDLLSETLGWVSMAAAFASLFVAQFLVKQHRLYHFGVEEAAAVAFVMFLAIAFLQFAGNFSTIAGFAGATIGALIIFVRFNYSYAAVAATLLAPMVVFDSEQSDTVRRLVACVLLLTIFFVARERREDHDPDYPADSYALVQAVAWASMYAIANLKVSSLLSVPDGYDAVYWITFVVVWVMPVAGLVMAIRDRHRELLNISIVMLIVTIVSTKPYLGVESKPWDPILFGLLLIAITVGVRRWLSSGPGGSRGGWIAERILASERDRLALVGNATVLAPGAPPAHTHDQPPGFGGGGSGGAGASAKF